jgi:hypothetical protein
MVGNVVTAKTEVVDEFFHEELSPGELDAVFGGWSISLGDIVDAAKWVYHHTVGSNQLIR